MTTITNTKNNYNLVGTLLLLIIIFEVSFGGGGRLIDLGYVSPRMYLFVCALIYCIYGYLKFSVKPAYEFLIMVIVFAGLMSLSLLISLYKHIPISAIASDIKPMFWFICLLFFSVTIKDIKHIQYITTVIKLSGLLLALMFLLLFSIWKLGFVSFSDVMGLLNPLHDPKLEFYFRGEMTFFFKAIIYVAATVFFSLFETNTYKRMLYIVLMLLTIAFTLTRGVWLSVFLALALYCFWKYKDENIFKSIILSLFLVFCGVSGVLLISEILPSAQISNAIRSKDLLHINGLFSANSAFFGNGLGAEILGRNQIEINYINIFYKQGILGLVFWLFPLVYIYKQSNKLNNKALLLAMPFLLSTLFVYIVSMTNPFLTNPIGMTVVLVTMVVTRVLLHSDMNKVPLNINNKEIG